MPNGVTSCHKCENFADVLLIASQIYLTVTHRCNQAGIFLSHSDPLIMLCVRWLFCVLFVVHYRNNDYGHDTQPMREISTARAQKSGPRARCARDLRISFLYVIMTVSHNACTHVHNTCVATARRGR